MRNMNLTPRPRDLTALLTGGRPAPADTGRPESAETEIPKKTYAAAHDMRIQEVIDLALEAYLA